MIKKLLMGTTAVALFDKENEQGSEKTPAELRAEQRNKIEVTTSKTTEQPEVEKADDEEVEEIETEDKKEEVEEKIEQSEKTEEELETEKAEAKTAKERERIQKRIDKEVAKRKALETEVADLKKQLAAKPDDEKALTQVDVERLAEEKNTQRQLANDCDKLFKDATKIDKDFKGKIDDLTENTSKIETLMIGVLADLDNGGMILNHFIKDPDEYERINELAIKNPIKMGMELKELSNKLLEETKPKPKKISKVPAPLEEVKGGRQVTNEITQDDTKNMKEFVRKRMAMKEERRKAAIR